LPYDRTTFCTLNEALSKKCISFLSTTTTTMTKANGNNDHGKKPHRSEDRRRNEANMATRTIYEDDNLAVRVRMCHEEGEPRAPTSMHQTSALPQRRQQGPPFSRHPLAPNADIRRKPREGSPTYLPQHKKKLQRTMLAHRISTPLQLATGLM
jgi:hypothetical protein